MISNKLIEDTRKNFRRRLRRASRPARRVWPRTSEALIGILCCLVIILVLLTHSPTLARHASHVVGGNKYLALIDGLANPFRNRSLLLQSGIPIYDLKIKRQPYAVLESAVEAARKQGWMSEDQKTEVNAKFLQGEQEYDVSVRVRGDLPPHWEGPKKSWRIKFGKQKITDGDQTINQPIYFEGKRSINLVVPNDRDFVVAPFVNALMREAGLIVPRDKFVVLRINGRLQGLYYEVEHFDKPLLSAHGRPETTVFGQNDRAMHFEQYTKHGTAITADAKYDLGTVRRQVDEEGQLALRAMQVLMEHARDPSAENFRRAQAVLDWDKYLSFRVLTTLFNTNHVRFGSDNLKLYYDPSRGLLEPIPWDVHLTRMPKEPGTIDFFNSHGPDELQRQTLLDPQLRLQRNEVLWRLIDDGGDRLISKYRDFHDRIRPLAWADVLTTPIQGEKMDILKRNFEFNVKRVHKVLSLSNANLTYRLEADDRAVVEMAALNFSGMRLTEMRFAAPEFLQGNYQLFEDANDNGELDQDDPLFAEAAATGGAIRFDFDKLILPQLKYDSETMNGVHWEFFDTISGRARFFVVGKLVPTNRHTLEWTAPTIRALGVNAVTGTEMSSDAIDQAEPLIGVTTQDASHFFDLDAPQRTRSEFLEAHPEFVASEEHPNAVELSGDVELSGTVIVPQSVPLIVRPGTDVAMGPGASVVCYGGLMARGTDANRIRIHADGSERAWGSFAVVRPQDTVILEHVDFSGGDQAQINGILFSGGVAIHNGDLEVKSCRFIDMRSEDGLNLKNGRITLHGCLFSGNASDGVDLDFVTGEVADCHFVHSVNDGLDISGTAVTVKNCRFESNGDKGLSVGEDSHPTVLNCLFVDNQIGTSSKDLSHARIAHTTYVNNRLAIEAKRKKPFFGGGSAEFVNCVFAENDVLVEEDYFSRQQVGFLHTTFDVATQIPTCQTEVISFRSPTAGDYRLTSSRGTEDAFVLGSAEWLNSEAVPPAVQEPGVYDALDLGESISQTMNP